MKRFILVGETLNVHRAAEKAHISQPALSRDLKKLEEELGFPLFERVGKRLILTSRGKRFLEKVRFGVRELEEAKENVLKSKEEEQERVVVVSGYTTIHFLLPQIARFLSSHPKIDLRLIAGRDEEVFAPLENGEADFAVGRYGILPPFVEATPLFPTWRVLILNKNGSLKVKKKLTLKELAQLPLCIPGPPSKTYQEILSIFANEGLTPNVVFRTQSNENVCQAVLCNPNWAGIIYLHALTEEDLDCFEIYDLRSLFPSWQVLLLRRKTAPVTEVRKKVYDFLTSLSELTLDRKGKVEKRHFSEG